MKNYFIKNPWDERLILFPVEHSICQQDRRVLSTWSHKAPTICCTWLTSHVRQRARGFSCLTTFIYVGQ